jgi:hypothetical protein
MDILIFAVATYNLAGQVVGTLDFFAMNGQEKIACLCFWMILAIVGVLARNEWTR